MGIVADLYTLKRQVSADDGTKNQGSLSSRGYYVQVMKLVSMVRFSGINDVSDDG